MPAENLERGRVLALSQELPRLGRQRSAPGDRHRADRDAHRPRSADQERRSARRQNPSLESEAATLREEPYHQCADAASSYNNRPAWKGSRLSSKSGSDVMKGTCGVLGRKASAETRALFARLFRCWSSPRCKASRPSRLSRDTCTKFDKAR